ncbi:hypothetical protein [uncultured Polaribacter sp.]|uniref:hypothetical protein n=1 Tax=uncultured Polaribacter sp. TaxID=174711 RepID=UPI002621BE64|nr:hypothetical protein [uncultured Polaribacter sp.]
MKSKRKISKTFIGFLFAAIAIWLLITLSKEYVITINFPLKYVGIAQDKILQTKPRKDIDLLVKASGFKILKTRINAKILKINANIVDRKVGTTYYVLTKNQQNKLKKQLPKGLELLEIAQDTLFLDLGSLVTKKVPVKANLNIKYHLGYDLAAPINIAPDSILVYGPETYIQKLKYLELLPLTLDNVMANFKADVGIKKSKKVNNLKLGKDKVQITGIVENFTEGNLEVPYKLVNVPENTTVNTLTKKVSVSFIVSLKHFNKINQNSFQIVCDYALAKKNNASYFVPQLVYKSNLVKSYKITPNKVDFLIEK